MIKKLLIIFLPLQRKNNDSIHRKNMNFIGLVIGIATFLIIGLFHPIVIKVEYYFGAKSWWWFLVAGIVFVVLSIMVKNVIISTILGVVAFSSFWSILELRQQSKRVDKGWFPQGPGHKK